MTVSARPPRFGRSCKPFCDPRPGHPGVKKRRTCRCVSFLCSYVFAPTHFYAVIFLCSYAFIPPMRPCFYAVRLCTAYAATLLCSPFMRSCFCAVMLFYADEAFTRSRFYAAEPFTQAHSYAAALFMQPCFYAVLDGKGPQGNGPEGGSWEPWGWPCPCAALWVSRPSRPAPLPAGRRRWNPGRIFHGWRPWCAPVSPAFPAAG